MKKIVIIWALLAITVTYSKAQTKTVGAGLAFGTDVSQPGIIINGQYFISDALAVAPNFIFYFAEKSEVTFFGITTTTKASLWEFNADVNYYFYDEAVKLYGIGGLNLSFVSAKFESTAPNVSDTKSTDTNVGLNLGIGSDFKTSGNIIPFALMKFTISDYQQLVIAGGVRFAF